MLELGERDVDQCMQRMKNFYYVPKTVKNIIRDEFACRSCKYIPLKAKLCNCCKGIYCDICSDKLFTCNNRECADKNKVLATTTREEGFEGIGVLYQYIQEQDTVIRLIEKSELFPDQQNGDLDDDQDPKLDQPKKKVIEYKLDKSIVDSINKLVMCICCNGKFITPKDVRIHLADKCPLVEINCKFCFKNYPRKDFANETIHLCHESVLGI
jgi:hypothetical protein